MEAAAVNDSIQPTQNKRRGRRRLGCTLVALLLGLLLPEVVLRGILFSDIGWLRKWGSDLRSPSLYANPRVDSEFWRLEWALNVEFRRKAEQRGKQAPPSHPQLGWLSKKLSPETMRPVPAQPLEGKRPILLYGASFAEGVLPPSECMEGVVAASELGEDYVVMNYGVGGYGLDQAYLLMLETLPLYDGLDPIVVIMPVLDSDMERTSLDFRSGPKPSFELRDGELVLKDRELVDGDTYIERHGIGITSYAWNYLAYARGALPKTWQFAMRREAQRRPEGARLIDAIMDEIRADLDARELQYFFLLCSSPQGMEPNPPPEVELRLRKRFGQLSWPVVFSREYFDAALEDPGTELDDVFILEGRKRNHPNLRGNQILLEALRDGLRGRYNAR